MLRPEVNVLKKLRARFQKLDRAKYISHLDLYRFMQRTFKRARISVWYTQGFNPHLYIMFPLPLSLGFEGECEIMDFNINDDNLEPETVMEKLNSVLPEGIRITEIYQPVMKHTEIEFSHYEINLISGNSNFSEENFRRFMGQEQIIIQKKTKQKTMKEIDIKPFSDVSDVYDTDEGVHISLRMPSGSNANYNPSLLLSAFYQFIGDEPVFEKIKRVRITTGQGENFR